ncbi:MAG: RimK family alpha-L-glutamate ligase [Pseudomonadota bacterium]
MPTSIVAIGARLRRYPQVTTLGLKPNWDDYTPAQRDLIRAAPKVYYPTTVYAELLTTLGRPIFPSLECHLYEGDKIRQTAFFKLAGLPHPRTRVFYGRQAAEIPRYFSYPFIAKAPRASALGRGVFLVQNAADLAAYLARHRPAYIQEYLPVDRDLRVVVIDYEPVTAYWRVAAAGEFRSNLAQGGVVDFNGVPAAAVELAVAAARLGRLDEVGLDLAWVDGQPTLLEFNVKYGRRGPALAGIDVVDHVARLIFSGRL